MRTIDNQPQQRPLVAIFVGRWKLQDTTTCTDETCEARNLTIRRRWKIPSCLDRNIIWRAAASKGFHRWWSKNNPFDHCQDGSRIGFDTRWKLGLTKNREVTSSSSRDGSNTTAGTDALVRRHQSKTTYHLGAIKSTFLILCAIRAKPTTASNILLRIFLADGALAIRNVKPSFCTPFFYSYVSLTRDLTDSGIFHWRCMSSLTLQLCLFP